MNKALNLAMEDMELRLQTLVPVWTLGTGAQFGRLHPIARHLSFALLAKLFYQELIDDLQRTREDMIHSVLNIAEEMKLECTTKEAEVIVDALMVNEASTKHTFSFQEEIFNDETKVWETFRFQYIEIDRDATDFEEGYPVYRLSDVARSLFLNTNEIQRYLPISIQQILVELLIEKGELKSAIRMLDSLNHRVILLIREEKIHKDELLRNPKQTIYENKHKWGKQLNEVEQQFQEETEKYQKLDRILERIAVSPEHQDTYFQLSKQISKTKNNHDKLARFVIENIRLEIQIRNTQFRNFWLVNTKSFRKTIWEEKAKVSGFSHPDDMLTLVEMLFSPLKPSILPLEWGIAEQKEYKQPHFANTNTNTTIEKEPITLDWDNILALWKPIFNQLLEHGQVSLAYLQGLDEFTLVKWVEHREAFDFWLTFASMEESFVINDNNLQQAENDERAILVFKLIEKYEELSKLKNKQIRSLPPNDSMILRNKIDVSIYTLILEEVHDNESSTNSTDLI